MSYEGLPHCTSSGAQGWCLADGNGRGHSGDVVMIMLGGVPARSFYIAGGPDEAYHLVQTTQAPFIELKMYVAEAVLIRIFKKS